VAVILPRDVALTEFVLDGNKLVIRGTTSGSPAEMIAAFEKSSVFENAAFTSPIAAQGRDRQGFQLQAFVRETARAASPESRTPAPSVQSREPRVPGPERRSPSRSPRPPSRAPGTSPEEDLGVEE
jgi:hypothetical protein